VSGLGFNGSSLVRSHRFPPFHPRKYTFSFLSCQNVELSDNILSEEVLGKNIYLEGMELTDIVVGSDQGLTFDPGSSESVPGSR
jgi:hypothetical protein